MPYAYKIDFNGIFCLLQQNAIIAMKNSIYSKTYSTASLRNIMQKHSDIWYYYSFISCAFKRPCVDIILRFLYFVFFRITSCINPRHKYHLENFSSRDDIGRYTTCDTERAMSYYVYHIKGQSVVLYQLYQTLLLV